jgi:hypothetical protein
MQRDLIGEPGFGGYPTSEISEKSPRRPWGEMAVVADPDEFDDDLDDVPPTLPEPRPPTPSLLDKLDVERAEGEGMTRE